MICQAHIIVISPPPSHPRGSPARGASSPASLRSGRRAGRRRGGRGSRCAVTPNRYGGGWGAGGSRGRAPRVGGRGVEQRRRLRGGTGPVTGDGGRRARRSGGGPRSGGRGVGGDRGGGRPQRRGCVFERGRERAPGGGWGGRPQPTGFLDSPASNRRGLFGIAPPPSSRGGRARRRLLCAVRHLLSPRGRAPARTAPRGRLAEPRIRRVLSRGCAAGGRRTRIARPQPSRHASPRAACLVRPRSVRPCSSAVLALCS